MPFKACAPRALPPDVARRSGKVTAPSSAPRPHHACSGRQAPPAGSGSRRPGGTRLCQAAGGRGPGSLLSVWDPRVCRNRGGRGAHVSLPWPVISETHAQRACYSASAPGTRAVAAPGCPHSGDSQGTRLPRTGFGGRVAFLLWILATPTPQPHTHTKARWNTNTTCNCVLVLLPCMSSLSVSLLPHPPQIPRAPPFTLRRMTLGYATNNSSSSNNNYHQETCTPSQPVSFVLHILSYLIFRTVRSLVFSQFHIRGNGGTERISN